MGGKGAYSILRDGGCRVCGLAESAGDCQGGISF